MLMQVALDRPSGLGECRKDILNIIGDGVLLVVPANVSERNEVTFENSERGRSSHACHSISGFAPATRQTRYAANPSLFKYESVPGISSRAQRRYGHPFGATRILQPRERGRSKRRPQPTPLG